MRPGRRNTALRPAFRRRQGACILRARGARVNGPQEPVGGADVRIHVALDFVFVRDGRRWVLRRLAPTGESWGIVFDDAGRGWAAEPSTR